jgi:hypothetical protein
VDPVRSGQCRCRLPDSPLNRIGKGLDRLFYVVCYPKGNLQKESVVDKVAEVIPICTSAAEAPGWVMKNRLECVGYQDQGMVRGQVEA